MEDNDYIRIEGVEEGGERERESYYLAFNFGYVVLTEHLIILFL